jgi:hypothetical protein
MNAAGPGTENVYAGEGQKQFTLPGPTSCFYTRL